MVLYILGGAGFLPSTVVNLVSETEAAFSTELSKHAALPHRRAPAAKSHGTPKKNYVVTFPGHMIVYFMGTHVSLIFMGYISPIFFEG